MHFSEQLGGKVGYSSVFYLITLWFNLLSQGFFPLFHDELSSALFTTRCLGKKELAISIIGASLHVTGNKDVEIFLLAKKYRRQVQNEFLIKVLSL